MPPEIRHGEEDLRGGAKFGVAGAVTVLNWYEEHSYTPTLSFAGGNGTASASVAVGSYSRIGNRVFYQAHVVFTRGTASGALSIGGLPYPSSPMANMNSAASIDDVLGVSATAGTPALFARLVPSSSKLDVYEAQTNGAAAVAVTAANCAAGGSELVLMGHYAVS